MVIACLGPNHAFPSKNGGHHGLQANLNRIRHHGARGQTPESESIAQRSLCFAKPAVAPASVTFSLLSNFYSALALCIHSHTPYVEIWNSITHIESKGQQNTMLFPPLTLYIAIISNTVSPGKTKQKQRQRRSPHSLSLAQQHPARLMNDGRGKGEGRHGVPSQPRHA